MPDEEGCWPSLLFSKCSKSVNRGDFWAEARQLWPPGPRQSLHELGWWGRQKAACLGLGSRGVPLVTPCKLLQGPSGFPGLSAPREACGKSSWPCFSPGMSRENQAILSPSAPGTHRCLEQVTGTLKLRGLALEGGCDRIAFPQNLPGIPLESRQHPPPSIPHSEQMCYFYAVLGISSAQRGQGEEWHCTDMSGGSSWGYSGGQRLWQCC